MSKIKLHFLGTGASKGIPQINCKCKVCKSNDPKDKRMRTSALIQIEDKNFVIDCGPDFRQQMLSVECSKLDAMLFTHEHNDHTAGLLDIRPFYQKQGDIPTYANARVIKDLKYRFHYMFKPNKADNIPSLTINKVDDTDFKIGKHIFTPIRVMHGNLPILGYKIQNMAYITDASNILPQEKQKLKNLEVLVLNSFRLKEHFVHFNLEQALNIIDELKPKKAYLIHISHKLGLHKEVQKILPQNVFLGYDGLIIEV